MAELAIVIGNGFDLDLGLPSKYSDFIKSREWENVVKRIAPFLNSDSYRRHSLVAQLQLASQNSLWFDVEEEIHKFVLSHSENSNQEIGEIKNEFDLIKSALTDYLKRVSKELKHKADKTKLAYILLNSTQVIPMSKVFIYFNYTTPELFLEVPTYHEPGKALFTYVHGSLRDNDIVLGCDLQEGEKVNRQLSFMYKYNMLNRANHVARNILEAKEIIFFGHSVNEMDFGYFREFFKVASASPQPTRHLTFITLNEKSERDIKDNIRNQGISVTDLYNNLESFTFIHTEKLYKQDAKEVQKWDDMFKRVSTKTTRGVKRRN